MSLLTSHSLVMALRLPARAVSAPPLQPSEGASFTSALPLQASTDASFAAWLEAELAQAPGAAVYGDVFADLVQGVVAWRRRYRGSQALWRRLLRQHDKLTSGPVARTFLRTSKPDIYGII